MPSTTRDPILIAGTGHVGQALGRLLAEHGEPVAAVVGRDPTRTRQAVRFIGHKAKAVEFGALPKRAFRILVAVADSAIPEVAARLASGGMRPGLALHTCGAMGKEALAPLAAVGFACGAIHPLQSVASPAHGLSALHRCAYAIDGDPPALEWAREIATLLGGFILEVPAPSRPYYHAAGVMASNYIVALIDAAAILMKAAGVEQDVALRALAPLVEASAANALRLGPVAALTGPIQRGDTVTLRGHVEALRNVPESVRDLYFAAGRHALDIALRRGLDPERVCAMEQLLREV